MSEIKMTAKRMPDVSAGAFENAGEKLQTLMSLNSEMLEAVSQAGRTYFEGVTALNEELLNFANERLAQVSKTREVLMQCRDVGDILRVQQDWLRTASQEYISEATRLVDLSTKTVLSTVNPMMDRAKSAAEEVTRSAQAA